MDKDIVEAQRVLDIEARAIQNLKSKLDGKFVKALDLLFACEGKIVVTGMGKSGQVGRKISSTLSSTGSPSVFLHPAESSHGDLGVLGLKDVVIAISNGGETPELKDVIEFAARKGLPLIVMTGKMESSLARAADVALDISVQEEACPLQLAPTASSTATLALGDALAMALLKRRGFREENYAEVHPGGSLGRKFTRVENVMHQNVPLVKPETPMREVLTLMTTSEVRGSIGVVDAKGVLVGTINDGDIRRRLEKAHNPLDDRAQDIMSKNPKTIDREELAERALFMMEQFNVRFLFVVSRNADRPHEAVGLLHLQDLLKAKIR